MLAVDHQLRQIINECGGSQINHQSFYLQERSCELKQIHRDLDLSIHHLSRIDNDSSENEQEDLRITGFDYAAYNKPFPQLSERRLDHSKNKSKSKLNQSLESKRGAFSVLSNRSPRHKTEVQGGNSILQRRANLCALLSRVNKNKLPTNASRNMLLAWNRKDPIRQQADSTYELIRDQRRKADAMRHIMVLGKVMGENYRKGIKKLQARRKIFMRGNEMIRK